MAPDKEVAFLAMWCHQCGCVGQPSIESLIRLCLATQAGLGKNPEVPICGATLQPVVTMMGTDRKVGSKPPTNDAGGISAKSLRLRDLGEGEEWRDSNARKQKGSVKTSHSRGRGLNSDFWIAVKVAIILFA